MTRLKRWTWQWCVLISGVSALVGCKAQRDVAPDLVHIKQGDSQTAFCGEKLKKPLRVQVLGKREPGLLGGKGRRPPVAGEKVEFRILGDPHGTLLSAEGVEAGAELVVATDRGGEAEVALTVGDELGDCFVEAKLQSDPSVRPARFRAAVGLRLAGAKEGLSRTTLDRPLTIEVRGPNGDPLAGVPVHFAVEKGPKNTSLTSTEVITSAEGVAHTNVKLGEKTGRAVIRAEIITRDFSYRALHFKVFAVDRAQLALTVLGGLFMFIFGMRTMSEGLMRVAGDRLRSLLHMLTTNRFAGVAVGTGVTALVQSSSATTVMIVGFVNAGLLSLEGAIGLIYGANIGTTVTAQIISFKLDALAYPALTLGVVMMLLAKRKVVGYWGHVLAGFGLLFLGLGTMGGILKQLKDCPSVTSLFQTIDCSPGPDGSLPIAAPLIAVGIGVLVTVVIQSSSAAIGLLLALSSAGLLSYWTAVPMLWGSNIGTTITAILASIGTNRAAKRTACAHFIFNMFGALYMILLFLVPWNGHPVYLEVIDRLTAGDAFAGENIERHIANAHTLFNVFNTVVFLPFVIPLAQLCRRIVRARTTEEEEEDRVTYLEPHLLDTPGIALNQALVEVLYMERLARKSIDQSFRCFTDGSLAGVENIQRREEKIDQHQEQITDYLVQVSQRDLTEAESRQLPLLMHTVNDLERIGDHAENLVELAERRIGQSLPFSESAEKELSAFYDVIESMFREAATAIEKNDDAAAGRVLKLEGRANTLDREYQEAHRRRLEEGECNVISGVVFLDVIANLEKVGDHLTNVAEAYRESREWRAAGDGIQAPPQDSQ